MARSKGVSYDGLVAMVKKVVEETVVTRDVRHKDIAARVLVSPMMSKRCRRPGANILGWMLMKRREELIAEGMH